MSEGTLGDRILEIRKRRGGRARPESHDKFAAAMNALLRPEDQASGASVRRWENNEGKPSVVQGWALAQLDPEQRGTDWLAVDDERPATHEEGGAVEDFMRGPGQVIDSYPGRARPAKKVTKRPRTG